MSEFSYFATIEEGDDPKLFLASPGDVQDLRLMAQQVVDDLDGVGGPANSMTMFAWETTLKETLFNDAAPIQNQIYLPSDPLCKGVVAFFGERIGQPLAEDFPTHMLEELFANNPSDYYKMVRHWRPEEADRGGFPLTGSTFEVLVAIATDRRFKNTASGQELPMFLRFLAPKDVLEIEDPGRAKWGNRKLRKKMMELFEEDDNALDEKRLMIREQLKSLRNFAMYLKHIGLEPIFEPDERKIEEDFRKYLASNFVLTRDPLLHDPFRGLQFYDVHDNRAYFGRDTDVKNALSAIEKMCNAPKKRNCYWIKGISGVGKSSFLRAGIIGSFIYSPKYQTDYAYSVNRPNHLLNASAAKVAQTACPLRVLFEKCADAIRERPNCAEFLVGGIAPLLEDFDKLEPEKRPEWAARKLTACLGNAEGQEPGARHNRLVIGIDQFEEIVDMLDDEKLGPHWQLFIKFMELAPAQPDIVIISTFRKERLDKMLRHPELNALWHDTSLQCTDLAFPSPTELENIIRKPFEDHGRVSLDDALVAALREKIMLHVDRPRATTSGSFLPLVSLALQRLQVNVALPLIEKQFERKEQDAAPQDALKAAAAKRPAGKDKPSRVRVGLKDAVDYLDLEGAIAELAASAMNEAKEANALAAGEATVDNLLRQLVRWSGRDDKQFFLPHVPLPTDNAEKSLAKALIKHRLLVDDGEAGILLVHETVLKNWPEADAFCIRERPLHEGAADLLALAESWQQLDHDAGVVNLGLKLHAERAFEVLALWSHRFDEGSEKVQDVKDILLRNYCLAMIEQTCDPARIIENTPKKAPHILIPAFYQRNDILRAMLEKHPGSVDTPRSDKRTAVFSACFFNNIEMLELLLEYKAEMNVAEDDGWRPIHAAAVGGDPAMTRRLIKAGATFDPQDAPQKIHPLHLAAQGGNKELADYYIKEQSVDPDLRDSAGRTVVMHAILNDDAQMVRYLVETHGCALDICTVDGPNSLEMSAIHVAARDGCRESIQTVIELGVESDCPMVNGSRAIHLAANNDFPEAVRILAKHGADVDAPGMNLWTKDDIDKAREQLTATSGAKDKINLTDWSPLHFATAKGHTKVARALIEAKADPNKQNGAKETPMHLAVEKGNDDVAMYLSANGANMEIRDKDGLTVLQKAIIRDRFALAKELLRQGALLSSYSHRNTMTDAHAATLVHVAAQEPEIKLLNLLIEHGPDLSLPNALGRTPAHIAAEAGLPDHLARLLHTDDTALEKVDVRGHTPFDSACASGDLKCIELISKRCAQGTLAQTYPEALHIAVSHGRVRATGYLLGQGYNPQAYNDAGWTPLHIAAQRGRENVVKEILNHKINPLRPLRNDPDVTAFDLAAETGQTEVLKLLFHLRSPEALDLTDLIFLSLEHMHYDCAAYLLGLRKDTDSGLPVHPVTGLSIQELYEGQNAEMKKSKPTEERHSDALETHFGSVAKPTPAQTKQLKSQAVKATPQQYKTQSMMHGLASDLYPEFDRGETRLWSKMNETDLAAFVKRVAPVADRYELDGPELRGATRKLPWYDDVTLFQLFDPSFANPKLRIYYLEHQGNLYWLNGTSPPIHEINAKAPIKVNEANVLDYLRFFTFFVRGEEGPFYLCEHKDDPMIPSHAKIEKIIDGVVRPNTFEGMNDKGHYLCDGVVFYSNAIFIANFAVQPSGMVEMLDDEPIAADLPVKIDAPLS